MAPPAKKRRRNALPSSSSPFEDDESDPTSKHKTQMSDTITSSPPLSTETKTIPSAKLRSHSTATSSKVRHRAKAANHPHNAAPLHSPKRTRGSKNSSQNVTPSPEKKRRGKTEEKGKSADIYTFFTKQAQRQQAEGFTIGGFQRSKPTPASTAEDLDFISDNDGDDGAVKPKALPSSLVGLAAQKRARGTDVFKSGNEDLPSASQSQKFMRSAARSSVVARHEEDLRPWAERFAPANLDELGVHPRKVADVRAWLENVLCGRMRQRLLLLKGAAGTGKTTTVRLLAKSLGCDVLEWRNPDGSVGSSDGFQSMAAQFEEFMGRGGKFGQLDILSDNAPIPLKSDAASNESRQSLILIEEFPNTFMRSSTALQSFRSTILQYLAYNTPPLSMMYKADTVGPVIPVVMVVSETLLTTTSASADSFTAHRLLGPEILQHPGVGTIEFNPIAPTLLAKALEIIVQKESRKSGRRKTPGPLVLKKLGEVGDIRSATGSLEFLCLRGDEDGDWGAKVAFGKAKKNREASLTKMEEESLEMVTRREASLGIFHAVGKVAYNKRDEAASVLPAGEDVENLPDFMSSHARPQRSQVHVSTLIDETGTDVQTFLAALHENYILSCEAPPTSFDFSTLDHVNGCIDALSDSDLLCPSWDGSFGSTGLGRGGGGGDILRQDEISFQVAVRGLLFSLPNPVRRAAPAAGGFRKGNAGEAHKMFYPTSMKLWRTREEIESTIDLWVSRMLKGEEHDLNITAGAAAFARAKPGSVESWKYLGFSSSKHPSEDSSNREDTAPLLSLGTSARKEMLLERLPYMVKIAKSRKSRSAFTIRDMEKVTTFHGIGYQPSEDTPDDAEDVRVVGEEWATDRNVEGQSPKKRPLVFRGKEGIGSQIQQLEQKLVLSDDDIEDD